MWKKLTTHSSVDSMSSNVIPQARASIPLYYRTFFLLIEPIFALTGFAMAFFDPKTYLALSDPSSLISSVPLSTRMVMLQLANLYLVFAFNEVFILRTTSDIRIWKVLVWGMLISDFGHLYSIAGHSMGAGVYWKIWLWNAMDWGLAFVYIVIPTRICFLMGVGFQRPKSKTEKASH